ncbi:hypothetical protein RF11_09027 [Thelohanellus kitauei]|uniref:Retrotransposon gag domain-containing protein n=1 Tax=Thelohanellus kitauei TaxID=669202 RepID=A0A0C2N758_THEKT|nr:hypothetical protein RF11_09027 [Thelohanellus kitauei]
MLMESMTQLFSNANHVPAFEHFDPAKEEFGSYHKRLEHHFSSHGIIHEVDKKSRMLSWVGSATFSLLEKLLPKLHSEGTYEDLIKALSDFYGKAIHYIHARVEFNRCCLKPSQTYREWVAELRAIAKRCRFVCPNSSCQCSLVDENIRDAIIIRSPHRDIQAALLQKKAPTFEQALSIAEVMVITSRTINVIENEEPVLQVNKLDPKDSPNG